MLCFALLDEKGEKKNPNHPSSRVSCARGILNSASSSFPHIWLCLHTQHASTTQHKHLIRFKIATRSDNTLFFFFLSNQGNCRFVKLTMHMLLAISPSVSLSSQERGSRGGGIGGGSRPEGFPHSWRTLSSPHQLPPPFCLTSLISLPVFVSAGLPALVVAVSVGFTRARGYGTAS